MKFFQSKRMITAGRVLAKILEVGHWVAEAFMIAIAVCAAAKPAWLRYLMSVNELGREGAIAAYGFEVEIAAAGGIHRTKLLIFAIAAAVLFSLMAMIFRNLYLILKRSEHGTPFQPDNVRMLREIGIFSISVPLVGLVFSWILLLAVGVDAVEAHVSFSGFTMGLLVLCLTQAFSYGVELQKDADGLL